MIWKESILTYFDEVRVLIFDNQNRVCSMCLEFLLKVEEPSI